MRHIATKLGVTVLKEALTANVVAHNAVNIVINLDFLLLFTKF